MQTPPDQKYYNYGERGHYFNEYPNARMHLPSALIVNTAPISNKNTTNICFHCGQSGHFALQCPDRCQRQTPPNKKCYSYEGKRHFVISCPNPCSTPPLPSSTKASNHKGGSMSAKETTPCFNYGQVGHFANRCPNMRQLSTPTQGN
jgi:hypothetical protein